MSLTKICGKLNIYQIKINNNKNVNMFLEFILKEGNVKKLLFENKQNTAYPS